MAGLVASRGMICALLIVLFAPGLASAAQPTVDEVNGLLRRAEANLQSVASSIRGRTTPPRGSAGKLLARRLEQAMGDLTPAKSKLEQIPAGAEGRTEAVARYTAAAEEYNRLRTFLLGSDAPAEPDTADQGTPMGYQDREKLSGAKFNLREVEANAKQLTDAVEQLRRVEDQLSINYREVTRLLAIIANAKRKSGFVNDTLVQLPEDGQGVAAVRQRKVTADARVVTASNYLLPLNARLQNLINPANYPEFAADHKLLRELSVMFNSPEMLRTDRVQAAEVYEQAGAARQECIRIIRKYARLIQQQTDQGVAIEGAGNSFLRNHAEFVAACEAAKGTLPAEIRADLEQARKYAAEAVAEQKPRWFTGGIPQVMGFADDRIVLLTAIDAARGDELRSEYEAAQKALKKQANALRDLIIRENTMPPDVFEGDDRDEAIRIAISGWRVQQKEFDLLKVRIPAKAWARETKWTYSNGTWYFSDRSRLQVRLLVADTQDSKLAIDRPVNVWKDHQKGNTMIGVPFYAFGDELEPSAYMLRSRIQ